MKKPVKLAPEQLQAVIEKRVTKLVTITRRLPSGNFQTLSEAVDKFADENNVTWEDVRINNTSYGSAYLSVRRRETDEEKAKRVTQDEDAKYRSKKAEYDWWKRQEEAKVAQAQRVLANSQLVTKVCCNRCGCSCCK